MIEPCKSLRFVRDKWAVRGSGRLESGYRLVVIDKKRGGDGIIPIFIYNH